MASHRYGELSGLNGSLGERQDSMFDRYLEEMKPFVLRLPHKTGTLFTIYICQALLILAICTRSLSTVVMFCCMFEEETSTKTAYKCYMIKY